MTPLIIPVYNRIRLQQFVHARIQREVLPLPFSDGIGDLTDRGKAVILSPEGVVTEVVDDQGGYGKQDEDDYVFFSGALHSSILVKQINRAKPTMNTMIPDASCQNPSGRAASSPQ